MGGEVAKSSYKIAKLATLFITTFRLDVKINELKQQKSTEIPRQVKAARARMSRRLTDSGLLRKEVCPSDQEVEICTAIRERLSNSSKPEASEAPRFSPRFTGHIMHSTCGKYTKLSCDVD